MRSGSAAHVRLMCHRGEELRENKWNPVTDAIPEDILAMTAYAQTKGIKLMAYVYPCLHFMALEKYFSGSGINVLDLSHTAVQDWYRWHEK